MDRLSFGTAGFGGMAGTVVFAIFCALMRGFGWSAFDPELLLGTLVAGDATSAARGVGFVVELLIGGLVGIAYAAAFHATGKAGAGDGARFAAVHWVVSGILMGALPHPMVSGHAPAPGYFGVDLGAGSLGVILVAHLLFGATAGAFYRRFARDRAVRE